ncbi:MAG: DNA topoisomerase, partial [Promethearchaeia archaeon]
ANSYTYMHTRTQVYLQTRVEAAAGEEKFAVRGRQLVKPGWLSLYSRGYHDEADEAAADGGGDDVYDEDGGEIGNLPPFKKGEAYALAEESVPLSERMTAPPAHLSESELIAMMEKHGIGTDASIATHINNICERNYVQIAAGRRLVPTQLGTVLVQGYYRIDADLVLPLVRASIEQLCGLNQQP